MTRFRHDLQVKLVTVAMHDLGIQPLGSKSV
jgi:hypothetical protein